jgi:hypothetical protein
MIDEYYKREETPQRMDSYSYRKPVFVISNCMDEYESCKDDGMASREQGNKKLN